MSAPRELIVALSLLLFLAMALAAVASAAPDDPRDSKNWHSHPVDPNSNELGFLPVSGGGNGHVTIHSGNSAGRPPKKH